MRFRWHWRGSGEGWICSDGGVSTVSTVVVLMEEKVGEMGAWLLSPGGRGRFVLVGKRHQPRREYFWPLD